MKRVVVVGAGNWGKNLVRNFYTLHALAGIAEANSELRTQMALQYPYIKLYSNYEDVLVSDTPAIVIATPATTHYSLGMAALEAGKDVFIEKPMTLSAAEARHLAEYAEQHNRILMVGHLLLYQPAIVWMKQYLATGAAGTLLHVSTQRAKLGKVRSEENVWWSFAPHDISVVLHLLGNPAVTGVQAHGHAMLQPGVVDNIHVDLQFKDTQTAHLHCSWYWPLNQRSTVVLAEKQMLVYDEVLQTVTVHNRRVDEGLNNVDEGYFIVDVAAVEPLKLECDHFLQCLETRQLPLSDAWNGVAVVEILERVQEALHG